MNDLVDVSGRPLSVPKLDWQSQLELRAPGGELEEILREAVQSVEDELRLEDRGWLALSSQTALVIPDATRILSLRLSRLYHARDPLAHQAIRLWTDYTFGSGTTWSVPEKEGENREPTRKAMEAFWGARANRTLLSAQGQRRSSDKALVDGEIFFALFLGPEVKIRRVDPLEIT